MAIAIKARNEMVWLLAEIQQAHSVLNNSDIASSFNGTHLFFIGPTKRMIN